MSIRVVSQQRYLIFQQSRPNQTAQMIGSGRRVLDENRSFSKFIIAIVWPIYNWFDRISIQVIVFVFVGLLIFNYLKVSLVVFVYENGLFLLGRSLAFAFCMVATVRYVLARFVLKVKALVFDYFWRIGANLRIAVQINMIQPIAEFFQQRKRESNRVFRQACVVEPNVFFRTPFFRQTNVIWIEIYNYVKNVPTRFRLKSALYLHSRFGFESTSIARSSNESTAACLWADKADPAFVSTQLTIARTKKSQLVYARLIWRAEIRPTRSKSRSNCPRLGKALTLILFQND